METCQFLKKMIPLAVLGSPCPERTRQSRFNASVMVTVFFSIPLELCLSNFRLREYHKGVLQFVKGYQSVARWHMVLSSLMLAISLVLYQKIRWLFTPSLPTPQIWHLAIFFYPRSAERTPFWHRRWHKNKFFNDLAWHSKRNVSGPLCEVKTSLERMCESKKRVAWRGQR